MSDGRTSKEVTGQTQHGKVLKPVPRETVPHEVELDPVSEDAERWERPFGMDE